MSETPHEHDEEGNCIVPEQELPNWRFSGWDVVGILIAGAAGMCTVSGQCLNLLSREFCAMANYSRQNFDVSEAQIEREAERASIAAELRALVEGDNS